MSQFPFERKDKAKRGNKFQFGKSGLFHKQKQGAPGRNTGPMRLFWEASRICERLPVFLEQPAWPQNSQSR